MTPPEDVVHPASEFPDLPWETLDPGRCGKDWSVGRGGHGFGDRTWSVSIYHNSWAFDNWVDVWEVPAPLGAVFAMLGECARNDALRSVRDALGM